MQTLVKHVVVTVVVLAAASLLVGAVFLWSGRYDFAADQPHTAIVESLIEQARERSISSRAASIEVPDLSDPKHALQGAGNYAAMCAGCHLGPGTKETELSRTLYPAPPDLSTDRVGAAEAFWVIKHGVKASGMPAWGKVMSDDDVWNMVAFLQQLPELDETKYRAMVAQSGSHHHEHGGAAPDHASDEHHHSHADAVEGSAHDHHPAEGPPATGEGDVGKRVTHIHADGETHVHAPKEKH